MERTGFAIFALVTALLAGAARADVGVDYLPAGQRPKDVKGTLTLRFTGTLTAADYATVLRADREARAQVLAQKGPAGALIVFATLNSSGGNVETALDLGRYLRSRSAIATMHQGERCVSACVYLLAGASFR